MSTPYIKIIEAENAQLREKGGITMLTFIARLIKRHVFQQATLLDRLKETEDAQNWNRDLYVTTPGGLPRGGDQ